MSCELRDSRLIFFSWFWPMKKNRRAPTKHKKMKFSRFFTIFEIEGFSGLGKGGVSVYEPPLTLSQEILISSCFDVSTIYPEQPVAKTFNCFIKTSTCFKYPTSLTENKLGTLLNRKKLIPCSPNTAMLKLSLTFGVTLNEEMTNGMVLSSREIKLLNGSKSSSRLSR